MILLSCNDLKKEFGTNKLFEGINLEIQEHDKIGLVGLNGCGKTTLLKMLQGEESVDKGSISISKGTKIGYLEQQPTYPNKSVKDVLLSAFKDINELRARMNIIEEKMSNCRDEKILYDLVELYGKLCENFESIGGYEYEVKYKSVVSGLNLTEEFCEHQFEELSGGQKTKVLIAKMLLSEPNLLFLDEPTNYLDIESLNWLENYLQSFKGSLVIISHDRYFLDKVVNKIWELTPTIMETYNGNYSNYVIEKQQRFNERMRDYTNQQKEIKRMDDQVKWMKSTGSNVLKAKAHVIEHRMEKIEKIDKPVIQTRKLKMNLKGSRTPKKIIEFCNVTQGFDDILFEDVSGTVLSGDSIGIVGKNGIGKTTLIKTLLGELQPLDGTINTSENIRIGYLDQESKFENESKTILETYLEETALSNEKGRKELAKLGFFSDDVNKKVSMLSGGEKKRLKLALLIQKNPNLLILDEPTNHLDLTSREQLENILLNFEGTIISISHDRYFLNKSANKIWELTPTGIKEFQGNYDDFLEMSNDKNVELESSERRRR